MSDDSGLDDDGLDALAEDDGLVCFHSRPDLLMVDLDTPESFTLFSQQYEMFLKQPGFEELWFLITISKSGKGRHVYIKVPGADFSVIARHGIQAALGSDPKREMLGIFRSFKGGAGPVLFETPAEAAKVKEFLDGKV